ncbi:peptidoglycan-binding domain-containing protein [Microbacterium sp. 22195]|uniref:peptidoglycan-binding domain-containing protein n=1 Tax=Microbacterium sp. 22195 TaxID=3453891 RepID=UPI003F84585A
MEIRIHGKSVEPLAYIAERLDGSADGNRTSRPTTEIQRVVGATQDGIYGPDTTAKVRAYQASHGLTADGIWGPLTDAKAFPPAAPAPTGSSLIRAVQQKLKSNYPLYAAHLVVDGIQGPKTTAAIKEFQRRSGLTADGIVGPRTRKALGV